MNSSTIKTLVIISVALILLIIVLYIVSFNKTGKSMWSDSRPRPNSIVNDEFETIHSRDTWTPDSIQDLQNMIVNNPKIKFSIGGAKCSQGNQTRSKHSVMLDLAHLNRIVNLDQDQKFATVEAGCTWKKLIQFLNPYGLSVMSMQSFSDFSIGGSVSINAHGQNVGAPMVSNSIVSLDILLTDGSIVNTSKTENQDLFQAIVGGYGLVAIILQVTLLLVDDTSMISMCKRVKTKNYHAYFNNHILNNRIEFHSFRLSIDPKNLFEDGLAVTYFKTDRKCSLQLENENALVMKLSTHMIKSSNWAKSMKMPAEEYMLSRQTISRNNFLSRATIHNLKSPNHSTIDFLQEYFIPVPMFELFLDSIKKVIKSSQVNLMNATVRFVTRTDSSLLSYCQANCFAIVLYMTTPDTESRIEKIRILTRQMIDMAISHHGRFYLPYQLFATREQMHTCYPEWVQSFRDIKRKYDPDECLVNQLYLTYK